MELETVSGLPRTVKPKHYSEACKSGCYTKGFGLDTVTPKVNVAPQVIAETILQGSA